jgi:hypothetical protein
MFAYLSCCASAWAWGSHTMRLGTSLTWSGINFLAFRRLKIYTQLRSTKHLFFETVIDSEPTFQQSSKRGASTTETGFLADYHLRGLS